MYANRTKEEIDAANRYHTWCRGWSDGASGRTPRADHKTHPELGTVYSDAYSAGFKARNEMREEATKRFGHTPSILRTADAETSGMSTNTKEGEEQ
jgi:hypothetical protein